MNTKKEHHHSHHTDNHCGCSCGSHDNHRQEHRDKDAMIESIENVTKLSLTNSQISVLLELHHCKYLPVTRFIMRSSVEEGAVFTALAPVYLTALSETLENVKAMGRIFSALAEKGLISLDYHLPLNNYDYKLYTDSDVYNYFKKTVNEGKSKEKFLCDIAEIELGSMALTEFGEQVTRSLITEHHNEVE